MEHYVERCGQILVSIYHADFTKRIGEVSLVLYSLQMLKCSWNCLLLERCRETWETVWVLLFFFFFGREKNPPPLPCFIEAQLTKNPAYMYAVRVFSEIRTLREVASPLPHAVSAGKGPAVLILVATGLH